MSYKQISLETLFKELIDCILNNTERDTYYYKREYEEDKPEFIPINQIDLLDSRFRTIDNDFSEYE